MGRRITSLHLGFLALAGAALAVRLRGITTPDLGQAEHQKLIALRAWRAGDLLVDGEHPALFKAVALLSTAVFGEGRLGLRLPNAVAGAVIVVLVVLLGRRLHGPMAGWAAGVLAAFGTVAVGIDRVGKEDTLMLALALGAVLVWQSDPGDARDRLTGRWAVIAALCGAAAAAKYQALPLLPAIVCLGRLGLGPPPPRGRPLLMAAGVLLGAHLLLNPLIALPEQWRFIAGFVADLLADRPPADGSIVPTRGFVAAGELLAEKPVWYYGLYLLLKSQPVWIALVAAGAALAVVRRAGRDLLLLSWGVGWIAVLSVVPFGFARYLAPALPALALLGGAAVAEIASRVSSRAVPLGVTAAALLVPLAVALPYPTLYVNALGGGSGRAMHWTPDDAVGQLGTSAAITRLAALGPARVAAADPTLVAFLSDGRLEGVAVEDLPPDPRELARRGVRAVVVQPSQTSLGNAPLFRWLWDGARPSWEERVRGITVLRVYLLGPGGMPRR